MPIPVITGVPHTRSRPAPPDFRGPAPLSGGPVEVTPDAATQSPSGLTFTHTCSGTNRYLTVGIGINGTTTSVSTMTYAGVAMALISRAVGTAFATELWGLVNPAAGANSVAITMVGAGGTQAGAASFTNVDQTTPNGANGTNFGTGTSATSAALTVPTGGMLVDAAVLGNAGKTVAPTIQEWNDNGGDSQGTVRVDGTQNTSWTLSSATWAVAAGVLLVTSTAPTGTAYTDSGSIPVTLAFSGADNVDSVDAGTIPVTIALSGADQVASTDSGTITLALSLSGADSYVMFEVGAIPIALTLTGADRVASTDSGSIPITLALSGADQVASTDSGSIPLTVTLNGADLAAYGESGTFSLTLALTGADQVASTDAGTIPITLTITGVEQFGAFTGPSFDDIVDRRTNRVLPIP
jgi:hypothetical protein